MRQADEILILRRFDGYVRLHIPPVLYSGKAASILEKGLRKEGVRKVNITKNLGKVSVFYDTLAVLEKEILLIVDKLMTPLLKKDQQEFYEKTLVDMEQLRNRRLLRKAVVSVILIYLIRVHWRLISRSWIRDPVTHWPKLVSIGVLLYIHRKHIREAPNFE